MVVFIKKEYILYVILAGLIISFGLYYSLNIDKNINKYTNLHVNNGTNEAEEKKNNDDISMISVHISGAVNKPDILYSIEKGSRINDAIAIAGGSTEDADLESINLAKILSDGEKVYVPKKNEKLDVTNRTAGNNLSTEKNNALININTASKIELMSLNRVGEKTAEKIIAYRQNASFKKIEDIKNVSGIGESMFNSFKDKITVD